MCKLHMFVFDDHYFLFKCNYVALVVRGGMSGKALAPHAEDHVSNPVSAYAKSDPFGFILSVYLFRVPC